jgi:hypothetical protein
VAQVSTGKSEEVCQEAFDTIEITAKPKTTRNQCFYFENIFAEKNGLKIAMAT